jgi:hypothetical protein
LQFAATEERFAAVMRQNEDVAASDVSRHLKDAMAEGRVADQDPEMLAHALIGVSRHLARKYLYEVDVPVDEVADVAVNFTLYGLLGARS